ncbi:hypothetical protein KP509_15G028300 [Ceratopteris richardii]|uniref:Uncharacterized protein n=1 Tax=Ceratopteris richardii TaxID=49495 RepID=A0A8T2T5M2_CERRI|nr:hypothetical protein KP509_15G028300 [Ceratopteris richardii]
MQFFECLLRNHSVFPVFSFRGDNQAHLLQAISNYYPLISPGYHAVSSVLFPACKCSAPNTAMQVTRLVMSLSYQASELNQRTGAVANCHPTTSEQDFKSF